MFSWTNDLFDNNPNVLQSDLAKMRVTWFMKFCNNLCCLAFV